MKITTLIAALILMPATVSAGPLSGSGTPCTVAMWVASRELAVASQIVLDCLNGTVGLGGAESSPDIAVIVGSHPGAALGIDTLSGPLSSIGNVRVPRDLFISGRNQADTANWDILRWGYEDTDALSIGDTSGAWLELRHVLGRALLSAPNRVDMGTNPFAPSLSVTPGAVTVRDRSSGDPPVAFACFTATGQLVQSATSCQ